MFTRIRTPTSTTSVRLMLSFLSSCIGTILGATAKVGLFLFHQDDWRCLYLPVMNNTVRHGSYPWRRCEAVVLQVRPDNGPS